MNAQIRLMGESIDGVIIKLKDNCPGFEYGNDRPVNSFGTVDDGIHDDTEAIRRAMKSGKSTVYFNPGKYLINGVIQVPATVNRVNFMYCDLLSGKELSAMKKTGAFKIVGVSDKTLVFEHLYALERFYGFITFIEHASKRTLIISDLHVQAASMYFNSVTGGKVFIENSGCTIGGIPGAWARKKKLPGEKKFLCTSAGQVKKQKNKASPRPQNSIQNKNASSTRTKIEIALGYTYLSCKRGLFLFALSI